MDAISPRCLLLLPCLLAIAGCGKDVPEGKAGTAPVAAPVATDATAIRFRDITADAGVDSTYRNGREAGVYSILESLGGGTGACDYDRDGRIDLFFTGGGTFETAKKTTLGIPSKLFRNVDGTRFRETSAAASLAHPVTYTQGCSICDFDGDGFPDILVTGYAGVQLHHNLGDGTFEEIHEPAGLTDTTWSSSAAWGDLNGDGHPDLYLAHYVDWSFENDPVCPSPWPEHDEDVCPPRAFGPLPDIVYYSEGDGTFRDATVEAGLREDGKGLGVIVADFDHDSDLDVYVANDMVDNFLYQNDGQGRFTEAGLLTGTATDFEGIPNGSMGLAVCDYNGDLAPDLWVTNFEQETFALYRNDGTGNFIHASREAGITALGNLFVGFGTAMGDLDLDGDEDAVISNGHVVYYPTVSSERQLPVLLDNVGGGRFQRAVSPPESYFAQPHLGRGLAVADINDDGLLDIVAGHGNEPASLLFNSTKPDGTSVRLRLVGRKSSRDAVGGRVVLKTSAGSQLRHVVGGGSFQSQSDLTVHFGVPADAQPLSATITWPSGTVQEVNGLGLTTAKTVTIVEE